MSDNLTDEARAVSEDQRCEGCGGSGEETDLCGCCDVACRDCEGTGVRAAAPVEPVIDRDALVRAHRADAYVCPRCGSSRYETTLMGGLDLDRNSITCHAPGCGWTGKGWEMNAAGRALGAQSGLVLSDDARALVRDEPPPDPKPSNVVNLADARVRLVEGAGEAAHQRGEAMSLSRYRFDARSVGYDPDPGDPDTEVCLIVNGRMQGITMSAEDAVLLGELLAHAGRTAPSRRGA